MLACYIADACELGMDVDLNNMFQILPNDGKDPHRGREAFRFDGRVPLMLSTHRQFDRREHRGLPLLLMVRDPRDTLVSQWHIRASHFGYAGDLHQFVRDPEWGIARLTRYLNSWGEAIEQQPHHVFAYERLVIDAEGELASILKFLQLPFVEDAVPRAVKASSIDRMRELEEKGGVGEIEYEHSEENQRRVRRGKVHGFTDYLDEADLAHIQEHLRANLRPSARPLITVTGYGGGA
jgi:alcohol sulfotransferase